jgi:hypothetical protein
MSERKIEWKPIKGYEGLYEVSNNGKVRSCDTYLMSKCGIILKENKGAKIKSYITNGYECVCLYDRKKKIGKKFLVHRLVLLSFDIDNPENKLFVNHINGIKNDNRIENLEWVTHSENMIHSFRVLGNTLRGEDSPHNKMVYQYDFKGNLIKTYFGATEAGKENKLSQGNISNCCRGITNSYKGYVWSYDKLSENYFIGKKFGKSSWRKMQVVKYDDADNIIEVYESQREAAIKNNIDFRTLNSLIRKGYGKSRLLGVNFMTI